MSVVDKAIVFDLDETLGYFQEFGILWSSLKIKYSDKFIKVNKWSEARPIIKGWGNEQIKQKKEELQGVFTKVLDKLKSS